MFGWLFGKKRAAESHIEPAESVIRPPGKGWRQWFDLSMAAAMDPPSNYQWVELWRPEWPTSRVTRSTDLPYEMKGPGFWWRPCNDGPVDLLTIDSDVGRISDRSV